MGILGLSASLLDRRNMEKHEYAGDAAKIFSDMDFGVTAIASGGDHKMRPRQLTSFIGPE